MTAQLKSPAVERYLFRVEGMNCVKCIRKIQDVGQEFHSVKSISVHLGEHLLVTEARSDFPLSDFMKRVETQGFDVKIIPSQEQSAVVKKEQNSLLMRIGVAGFCAGNIMLLSTAEYLGALLSAWPQAFKVFEMICFFPVATYSAWPLYKSAWASIRAKKTSIDSPIVLALIGGALISTYNLFFFKGPVYFDSLAMFVFFLLGSRFIVHKIQSKYVSGITTDDVFEQTYVQKLKGDTFEAVKTDEIVKGDIVKVPRNNFIPFDSNLKSSLALIDDSLYTGEFLPASVLEMETVFAGSKNIGDEILIEVVKTSKESRLSDLIEQLNKSLKSKTAMQSLADQGAAVLTYTILAASALILFYFSSFDFTEGLNRVLALLVVACPCGLAIAVPLVQSLSVKRAVRNSLLVKDVSVFESVSQVKTAIFDKTGTLTLSKMKIVSCAPRDLTDLEKDIVYSLEQTSEHPIACALKQFVGSRKSLNLQEYKEVIGSGVQALYAGDLYKISADPKLSGGVVFSKNSNKLVTLQVEDTVDPMSKATIEYLGSLGIESHILSGDKKSKVAEVAEHVAIQEENSHSGQSPENKKDFVETALTHVLYVGDGVNDSLAMSKALVSVSMTRAADMAFKSSQVHILKGGVEKLEALFKISQISCNNLKTIMLISVLYNLVFAVLAACGYISPLVAVLIMPLSSISITFLGFYMMTKKMKGLR